MVLFLLGCAGVLDVTRATTLDPGELQIGVGAGAVLPERIGGADETETTAGASGAVGVRAGVAPGLELGATGGAAGTSGIGLAYAGIDAKVALTRPDAGVHVAVDPAVSFSSLALLGTPFATVDVPVLLGWDIGRGQLVVVPHGGVMLPLNDASTWWAHAGLRAGWVVAAGPKLEVVPALQATWFTDTTPGTEERVSALLLGAGVSFLIAAE